MVAVGVVLMAALVPWTSVSETLGGQSHGPSSSHAGPGRTDSHTLQDCPSRQGFFPIPFAQAQAMMPLGFRAATYLETWTGTRDPAEQFGELDLTFITCLSGTAGNRALDAPAFLAAFVPSATPPAPYVGSFNHYAVLVGAVHADKVVEKLWSQWGLHNSDLGEIAFTETGTDVREYVDTASAKGVGALAMQGAFPAEPRAEAAAESFRFFFVEDEAVIGGMEAFVGDHIGYFGSATFGLEDAKGWMAQLPVPSGAGFVSGDSEPTWDMTIQEYNPPEPAAVRVDHSHCEDVELFTSFPKDPLRPFVPSGFDIPDGPLVIIGAARCGPEGQSVGRGLLAIQVTPMDARLKSPNVVNYFWEPEHYLVEGTDIADAYHRFGAIATPAEVSLTVSSLGGGFDVTSASGGYHFEADMVGVDGLAEVFVNVPPSFREYSAAEGGYVYLEGAFGGGEGGLLAGTVGTLEITGSGPAATLYGASSRQGGGVLTELEYVDALVGFVAWP